MGLIQWLLKDRRAREDAAPGVKSGGTWNPPSPTNGKEYVSRCLEPEYEDLKEIRTYREDPSFARVLDAYNSQQFESAVAEAKNLLPNYDDLDLLYEWIGSSYRLMGKLELSRQILAEGLGKAKRKSDLLVGMGETEWRMGNIASALYAWSQSLQCAPSADDYKALLLLSYVAAGVGLPDVARSFLDRVDRKREVRLNHETASRLVRLTQAKKTEAMKEVIVEIHRMMSDRDNGHG
jgi:tetratricopeptide (TPR) repeat protein